MTERELSVFCVRYGIAPSDAKNVRRLSRLIHQCAMEQTHACNGDPHSRVADPTDKNACSNAWDVNSQATADRIEPLARSLGFDGVDYSGGLYPTLKKGNETAIIVP